MRSNLALNDWRGDLTFFNGFYNTRPAYELKGESWDVLSEYVAPTDVPAKIYDKAKANYFVPCRLKDEPLVGETMAKAQALGLPTIGKQRSASHVTTARLLCADVDGITEGQLKIIEKRLTEAELTYLIFSSHSYGRADKPGMRCRVVVPVDAPLDSLAYRMAAQGLNVALLDRLADISGFAMYQQQGCWATAPERVNLAFRRENRAGLCSAAGLIALAPKIEDLNLPVVCVAYSFSANFDAERVRDALQWFDSNDYTAWFNTRAWLKASYGDAAYQVWLEWSQKADVPHRATEDECATEWEALNPRIPAEAGAGALFGAARNAVVEVISHAMQSQQWGQCERSALIYLRRYHHMMYSQITGRAA